MESEIDQNPTIEEASNLYPMPPRRDFRLSLKNLLYILRLPFIELMTSYVSLWRILAYIVFRFRQFFLIKYKIAKIEEKLRNVQNYSEYEQLAGTLDSLEGNLEWKYDETSKYFDAERVRSALKHLRSLRESKDVKGLMHLLSQDLIKNFGGVASPQIHKVLRNGTKQLIENYHNEVILCI